MLLRGILGVWAVPHIGLGHVGRRCRHSRVPGLYPKVVPLKGFPNVALMWLPRVP